MNINTLVTHYVTFRRTLGERCNSTEEILRSFCRTLGPGMHVRQIRLKAVTGFLVGSGVITGSWHIRHSVLKGFFRFAVSRGHLKKAPLPTKLPKRPPTALPYIYSREELRRLLGAIPTCQRSPFHIEPRTLQAMLLVLYGAGLRRSEVLKLSIADVDLPNGMLTIRESKFFKTRVVPFGDDLKKVLTAYARWRTVRHPPANTGSRFFVDHRGAAINDRTLNRAFKRLREHVGIRRADGSHHQPRLHDLRHTFAVHRLTAWYHQGADVQRLVYHLSVYLGHVRLPHTQVYLTMTPELLQQAGVVFERYARKEDSHA
jgi:integrase/recombinase XerD